MSQAKITLRPPPNIDFVHGYPGIPSGPPDRPQAAVKGEVEVRAGGNGVKAKWVRIELRKVETLPGGGLTNTFFDFVGNSPVLLWQSGQEYSYMKTQDFPFNIRIPEAIPPSISLEKGAGVRYELIATVGIKGKKGFFRRDKDTVLAASTPIIIDKHELHTTWPVYAQPETRRLSQDGVTLTVERTHTCYGPGDRITVMATTKSDTLNTVILRGFEFCLRETVIYRGGPHNTGKKGAPQTRVNTTGEQKVPVNTTLYGGGQHKAELTITIPAHHTTTSLSAARHIDITYVLSVKALMGTGLPLVMDLPVIISNWPRPVSLEAVRRIGLAPNVASPQSQLARPQAPPQPAPQPNPPLSPTQVATPLHPTGRTSFSSSHPFSTTAGTDKGYNDSNVAKYNTTPNGYGAGYTKAVADEFGGLSGVNTAQPQTIGIASPIVQSPKSYEPPAPTSPTGGAVPRPRSSGRGSAPSGNRLTVANFGDDMPEEAAAQAASMAAARTHTRQTSLTARNPSVGGSQPAKPSSSTGWVSAEEEKRKLYERAVANVERVQGVGPSLASPSSQTFSPVSESSTPKKANGSALQSRPSASASAWPSAEEEKLRLYNQAQTAANRLHGIDEAGGSGVARNASASGSTPHVSAGAALYSQAMSSINRTVSAQAAPPPPRNASPPVNQFPSADQEKAALRRYHEAKAAVDRSQGPGYGNPPPPSAAPISYDALYGPPQSSSSAPPPPSDLPPSFEATSSQAPRGPNPNYLSEKEKLRRAYEAQDAAALAQQQSPALSAVGAPGYIQAPSPAIAQIQAQAQSSSSSSLPSAYSEKEMLRRRYEAQDAAAAGIPTTTPTPPPRTRGSPANTPPRGALPQPRSPPIPTSSSTNNYQPLSAAEEKARLKARYEAEANGVQPNGLGLSNPSPPYQSPPYQQQIQPPNGEPDYAVPPPLAPRPPKHYVQQNQGEMLNGNGNAGNDQRLNFSPVTPFTPGFVNRAGMASDPPPPLPPNWQPQ